MTDYIRTACAAPFGSSVMKSAQAASAGGDLNRLNSVTGAIQSNTGLTLHLTLVNHYSGGHPVQYEVSALIAPAGSALTQALTGLWDKLTQIRCESAGGHNVTGYTFWRGAVTYVSTSVKVLDVQLATPQLFVDLYSQRPSEYDLLRGELLTDLSGVIEFDNAGYIPSGIIAWGNVKLTDRACMPVTSRVASRVYQPPAKEQTLVAPWGPGNGQAYTVELPYLTEPPVIVPGDIPAGNSARVNVTVNSVDVIALPGNEPLNVADIRISADRDTFSWQLTCEIRNKGSLDLIKPDATGYKELAVIINGHRFEFFVPKYSASRKINGDKLDQAWRITGYSRSQYLGAPYAQKRTRSITSTTAVQAATGELLGTDFTLDWYTALLPDWSMPNNSFSYQDLTPIEVIKRLATTAGGIVLADPVSNILYVRPRYLVSAWQLLGADMDRSIYESQILSESMDSTEQPLFNSVVVSGEAEGVALTVNRLGTAGDNPAPDITDGWLTALEANKSRGAAILSSSGKRQTYSLDLAIPEGSGQPGLLIPGLTVAVLHDDPALNYRAYVDSLDISVPGRSNATVVQTVRLDRPAGWEAA